MLPHNVLFLLLELSQSPTNATYSPSLTANNVVTYQQLTWEDIIKESPLTGAHWKMPDYTLDSDDEYESDYNVVISTNNINVSVEITKINRNEIVM
jgi:hypothetical protein